MGKSSTDPSILLKSDMATISKPEGHAIPKGREVLADILPDRREFNKAFIDLHAKLSTRIIRATNMVHLSSSCTH